MFSLEQLEKLDTIDIGGAEELQRLIAWRDNNKELVRNFRPVLQEGVIKLDTYLQYFEATPKYTLIQSFFKVDRKIIPLFTFAFVHEGQAQAKVVLQDFTDHFTRLMDTPEEEAIQDALTTYCSLMAYMENYIEVKDRVRSDKHTDVRVKKPKHGKKNKRVVRAARTVYTVIVPQSQPEANEGGKRNYERHTESWGVKGFWREYKKSGKRIWIEPTTKGSGRREAKNYRM